MNQAIATFNQYAAVSGSIQVHYDPNVPTAQTDRQFGTITFGNSISYRVALHEMSHWLGTGTDPRWWNAACRDSTQNLWVGHQAVALVQTLYNDVLHADGLHFWPGGLNYDNELTDGEDRRHVLVTKALLDDMNAV